MHIIYWFAKFRSYITINQDMAKFVQNTYNSHNMRVNFMDLKLNHDTYNKNAKYDPVALL